MKKPLVIAGRFFPARKDAIELSLKILYQYEPGERIIGEDEEFVRALFYLNPKAAEKLDGHTVSHFEVADQPEAYKKTRSFVVIRSDGHRDDFSLMKAVRAAPQ